MTGGSPEGELPGIADHPEDAGGGRDGGPAARAGVVRFARMSGSSICGRDAAPWVTDFLNAAYYRRPIGDRDVDDLRLAFSILTTFWWSRPGHVRLRATDLAAFHRAYGSHRFDDAHRDGVRRGWGIAFQTTADRAAYDPEVRLALARLGKLTPGRAPAEQQIWHTYPPVEMPSAEAAIAALSAPETGPDYASEIGRFTPLRRGGPAAQVFEIEVAAGTGTGWPMDEPPVLPYAAKPLVGFDLTTHAGHFMGSGHNRLLIYTHDGRPWARAPPAPGIRCPGTSTGPTGSRAAKLSRRSGARAISLPRSMLHQLALQVDRRS